MRGRLVVERMRRDERGAGLDGRLDRLVDAGVDRDEAAQPERERMGGEGRVGVVVGELETRDDEQAVPLARARRLALDLGEVGVEAVGGDAFGASTPVSTVRQTWSVMQRTSKPCAP